MERKRYWAHVDGAGQAGTELITSGWGEWMPEAGDIFTIDGVYGVNPDGESWTGRLQYFAMQESPKKLATNGNAVLTIAPAIIPSGKFRTVTNSPANGARIQPVDPILFGSDLPKGRTVLKTKELKELRKALSQQHGAMAKIARSLGISRTAVSLVLNGVSKSERVLKACKAAVRGERFGNQGPRVDN